MQHEVDTEHRWSAAKWIGLSVLLLMVLLVLYVLSIGPVAMAYLKLDLGGSWMGHTLEALYWPLTEAVEQSETATRWLEWYVGLWGIP